MQKGYTLARGRATSSGPELMRFDRVALDRDIHAPMLAGLDQLYSAQIGNLRRRLRGAQLAVLTHAAAIDRRGRHLLTVLEELCATPQIIFTLEHGLFADAQAEEPVNGAQAAAAAEALPGPRIIRLYGDSK